MGGMDVPCIDNVVQKDTIDVDTQKEACETQLMRTGIDVTVFTVDARGAYFKLCVCEVLESL